jgi:hypothetical protein
LIYHVFVLFISISVFAHHKSNYINVRSAYGFFLVKHVPDEFFWSNLEIVLGVHLYEHAEKLKHIHLVVIVSVNKFK